MTTLTVMHLMGADPIPWKSDKLHYVQLDNWDVNNSYYDDGRPPDQVTYRDATALMAAGKADKQAAMFKIALPIQPENPEVKPFNSLGRVTYADFFAMFEPPFAYGGPWDRKQDDEHARVDRADQGHQREALRRTEQRRQDRAHGRHRLHASSACSATGSCARATTT